MFKPTKFKMIEGRNGTICCEVNNNSLVSSTILMKNNEILQRKTGNTMCVAFSSLNRNDSGNFTCLAKTDFGS